MGKYTDDGGVISSKNPISNRETPDDYRRMFGIYRGIVVRSVYPDDPKSVGKYRMEYVIRVRGQEYPNAVDMRTAGGIYQYEERIRKGIEKSSTGTLDHHQFHNNLDGEHVFIMFVEGNGDVPLIIGGDTHPQHAKYKNPKKEDGIFQVEEFNGLEVKTDKDSNLTFTQVGRKDKDGKILNADAVKSQITMYGKTGDIELNTHGTQGSGDLRIKLTKKDKKIEVYAQDNKIVMGADGINITDKGGDNFNMKNGSVEMTIKGDFTINADGKTNLTSKGDISAKSDGNVDIEGKGGLTAKTDGSGTFKGTGGTNVGDAGSPTMVDGVTVALAGGGAPVARLGDMVVGTGNLGAPVVSQILQGSPKVSAG